MSPEAERAGGCVLIVDDSPTVLRFVRQTLEGAGMRVETSRSPWIAHVVSELHPSVILIDYDLGVSHGTDIVRALRHRVITRATRLVLYSSLDASRLEELASEVDADGFICKSGDPNDLLAAVRRFLPAAGNDRPAGSLPKFDNRRVPLETYGKN